MFFQAFFRDCIHEHFPIQRSAVVDIMRNRRDKFKSYTLNCRNPTKSFRLLQRDGEQQKHQTNKLTNHPPWHFTVDAPDIVIYVRTRKLLAVFPSGEIGETMELCSIGLGQKKAASAEFAPLEKQPYLQHDSGLLMGAAAVASHGSKSSGENLTGE